jgi:hypothetical protein
MITEYQLISDISSTHLEHTVNSQIKQGWQPIGGIAVVHTDIEDDAPPGSRPEGFVYIQAMGR